MMEALWFILLLHAIPPSPAGGGYLDLSGNSFYFAQDSPALDALLKDEWTIEMWIYIESYPPIPEEPESEGGKIVRWRENFSPIMLKPLSFAFLLGMLKDPLPTLKGWECHLYMLIYFPDDDGEPTWFMTSIAQNGELIDPKFFQGPIMELEKWHHVAVQLLGGRIYLYFDGFLDSSEVLDRRWKPRIFDSKRRLFIGMPPEGEVSELMEIVRIPSRGVLYPFEGAIDELRISDVARYRGRRIEVPVGRFERDAHTLALWHFDEPPGSLRYEDSSGNGNALFSSRLLPISPKGEKPVIWGEMKGDHPVGFRKLGQPSNPKG